MNKQNLPSGEKALIDMLPGLYARLSDLGFVVNDRAHYSPRAHEDEARDRGQPEGARVVAAYKFALADVLSGETQEVDLHAFVVGDKDATAGAANTVMEAAKELWPWCVWNPNTGIVRLFVDAAAMHKHLAALFVNDMQNEFDNHMNTYLGSAAMQDRSAAREGVAGSPYADAAKAALKAKLAQWLTQVEEG